jgi:3-hydroxyisobutyrate dehydrogenase
MVKVAVLGLGIMGSGMARQLIGHGFEVAVWNRSAEKATALAGEGARAASTPADAASGAAIVVAMLSDDDASHRAWLGDNGALAAMAPGSIAIECSTLTINWVRQLAAAATTSRVRFLDAPVTGSKAQAQAGELQFLVGGEADTVEHAAPVFAAMGGGFTLLGPNGSGAILKLVNNFLCGVQVASLAEAVAMIERSGLDSAQAVKILGAGAPGSPLVKAVSQRMLEKAYEPNFFVPLMAKDLAYASEAFSAAGIEVESARAARARFVTADEAGHGQADIAAVIEPLRAERAG